MFVCVLVHILPFINMVLMKKDPSKISDYFKVDTLTESKKNKLI